MAYRATAKTYRDLGYAPFPVEGDGKFPPVSGVTGYEGVVTDEKIKRWRKTHRDNNVAVRAEGWIGIDVDVYDDKRGDLLLASWEERLGKLPPAPSSTARGKKSPSRQYLFRVPEGVKLATRLGDSIEIIQWFHRYTVCAPSIHPTTKKPYRWYDAVGKPTDWPPFIDGLPDLPEAWLAELSAAPDSALQDVDVIPHETLLDTFAPGPECYAVKRLHDRVTAQDEKSHIGHDDALAFLLEAFMLGREGHSGAADVVREIDSRFRAYLTKKKRPTSEADRLIADRAGLAQRKVVEDHCRCLSGLSLTELTEEEMAIEKSAKPLTKTNGALVITEARERFLDAHPVKRYARSNGAAFMWINERWSVVDLNEECYKWLARRIGDDMTIQKARELEKAVHNFAEIITDNEIDSRFISVENGLLDWQTGELRPRTPDLFVINHLPVAWRPDAHLGRSEEWFLSTFDADTLPHAFEIIGYAVSPVHDLKLALAMNGMGGGGKSAFLNIITNLIGDENTSSLAPQSLGERFNRAQLLGKLLNAAGDVGAETLRHIGIFKSIIARDAISAEYKGRDGFTFRPNAFVIASFNTLPGSESNDSGFWDRWLVLTFKKRFATDGVKVLKENTYWRDEMPFDQRILEGILVEAVSALRRLRARGGFDKAAFLDAKNQWRQEVDSVAAFAEEKLLVVPDGRVLGSAVHDLYTALERKGGGQPRNHRTFYRELLSYLEEKYPGKVEKVVSTGNKTFLNGVKVIHSKDDNVWNLVDPDEVYGKLGWSSSKLHAV